ncbi:MAG: hypothetical protein ACRC2H_02985 [Silanimonas sp.]
MGTARRLGIALSTLLAVSMAGSATWLWPLMRRTDATYMAYVQRDVSFGWLLLQAATPLFVLSAMTGLGAAVLAWRLADRRPGLHPQRQE